MGESKPRVGVIGATGYSGMELIRLLLLHPNVQLTYLAGSRARSESFGAMFLHLAHLEGVSVEAFDVEACKQACDLAFVALPSGESGRVAAALWSAGLRVIDLSGDLRLPADVYQAWYGHTPVETSAQAAAVYGLTEFARDEIASAQLVANPGCYATAAVLALKPLQDHPILQAGIPVIVDAKSGVTGAGRSAKTHLQFAELTDDFYPYKVGKHQHVPEIEQALGAEVPIVLTTQLLPVSRGIFASVYITLTTEVDREAIYQRYLETYANEPFVHVLPYGEVPHIKAVQGTNFCHIGLVLDEQKKVLQVFSVIDNLQKGAAGQALQNANLMLRRNETDGLNAAALWM
ncbi:N-acetyl-gamma-glutamyl-phosphate reductase [Alicyclobacillus fodiniaquatilis]|uniref:N-acetyl-gamma-glutamyl-phosphate reductase n=1 Tax=Alicyclobacillus fodiniaquatilis TaxID=1661150 RepID=A0ABW4JMI6_9BACL